VVERIGWVTSDISVPGYTSRRRKAIIRPLAQAMVTIGISYMWQGRAGAS
jgi:hypothetical protein